uniref:Prefoldin subunit 3 n=1 Tax=Tetraselmis sp. GSL018 TaxID=582737 RepID=A0A061SBJ8_9CHLO|mmetsp:Transcript_31048/g.73811  ORF Transcript_31048/g.73811 Transcript_31048/m.73811 type:complete len:188 (+) Transcript_31048:227-790(+)|eukprot:CAMPEP_0177590554 /NCGR_PEP_ID=MMETSP0419_2-20121207/7479_1 /TAXON_ID=582737 /ORGANISM="Tetraselmis sp., Strain GSL018" /LENGTH=187 /DNA_ID=CAMNT_0019081143 /DNA_START=211 /DNA_END=774 /DNA_ORIENTATION=-
MGEGSEDEVSRRRAQQLPKAKFIEDVKQYVDSKGGDAEMVIKELNSNYQNYKIIEHQLLQKRVRLQQKLPDIRKALDTVKLLKQKRDNEQDLTVDFELSEQVFTKAVVKRPDSVKLWLGANVMLEYPLEEAEELLETNLSNCKKNLDTNQSDLNYIKDCITTTEVSIARVYNFDVSLRKSKTTSEED